MVEAIKEEATKNWPLLLLVLLMTGGGTSAGNLLTGGNSDQQESIERLSEDMRELTFAVRQAWTLPMEVTAWDKAGRELRKTIADWQGPDVPEIRRTHFLDERVGAKQ